MLLYKECENFYLCHYSQTFPNVLAQTVKAFARDKTTQLNKLYTSRHSEDAVIATCCTMYTYTCIKNASRHYIIKP